MAIYEQGTFSSSQRLSRVAHHEKLFRDWIKETLVAKMMSEGDQTPVQYQRVEKGKGDVVYFGLRARNTDSFIMDGPAEGNESELSTYSFSVTMHLFRAAFAYDAYLSVQRSAFDIPNAAMDALKDNWQENFEALHWEALYDSPSIYLYNVSGTFTTNATKATAKAAISTVANNGITAQFLSRLKVYLSARRGTGYPPVQPVKLKGYDKPLYVLITHPHSLTDLWNDGTFLTGHRECLARGKDNPIFWQAESIYAGFLILSSEHVDSSADYGGATAYGCEAKILGRQALALAVGNAAPNSSTSESMQIVGPVDVERYGSSKGIEAHCIMGLRKTTFNSVDYGSASALFIATDLR